MAKYILVIELPQRKEFISFQSLWALKLRMHDLKAQGYECHIAR